MKKRILAAVMAGALLLSAAGCGENASAAGENGADAGTELPLAAGTESGEGEAAGQQSSALTLMQEINTAQQQVIDDNYRTWYEVFVYSFYDSDGDGVGDLNGLTEKLDYINDGDPETDTDLGCNGIWLMPIMPSTTYHKYDVTDYCDIDKEYGSLEDFQTFLDACHDRGINVIIDLVMNHSSSQHTWFQTAAEYLKGLPEGTEPDAAECPYVDYYYFSREQQNGYSPLEGTDWYYEARFWSEMPDLNLGNEAVRAEFEKIVDFWLDLGVDGFRLDAAKEYYSGSVDANIEVLSWFNDMVKSKKEDAYIVAEVWNDLTTYARYYESGIDSCFDFAFADSTGVIASTLKGGSASSYGNALVNLQETLSQYSDTYIDAPFYTNHDMARSAGYYSGDHSEKQTKLAQAMNLLMTGSSFLYYGEELGMKGSGKDENKRAPMYWSTDETAEGMCRGPLDMDEVKMKYGSYEEQQADGNSIYQFVKETIKLRNMYPELARGTVTLQEGISDDAVCAVKKSYDGSEVLLIYNISAESSTVDLSGVTVNGNSGEALTLGGVLLTGTEGVDLSGGTLTMPAYSVAVLK